MPDPLDAARLDARTFSGRLGTLAGAPPSSIAGRVPVAVNTALPARLPPRLAAVIDHFRRRDEWSEDAARTMRANTFVRD